MNSWDTALDTLERLVKDRSRSDDAVFRYFRKIHSRQKNSGAGRGDPPLDQKQMTRLQEIIRLMEWRRPALVLMLINSSAA
jgi:hypothetical protein